jgi:hypothetical protein
MRPQTYRVELIEEVAIDRGLCARRMTSGAGHNAQMMLRTDIGDDLRAQHERHQPQSAGAHVG